MSKTPIWIDTDTGVDDMFALLCAFQLEKAEVVGISSVAGNVSHDLTFKNARNVTSLAGREDIPVYPGAEKPMVVEHVNAEAIHGKNGLGEVTIPESKAKVETMHAWDAMMQAAKKYEGLEIVAVGPLTNLAIAITKYPDLKEYVKRIVIMGGAVEGGNATACAEFNIYVDPHSAETVMKSGIDVVMFGLDVTMKAYVNQQDIQDIEALGDPMGSLFPKVMHLAIQDNSERIGRDGVAIHDVCPIMYYDFPELFEGKPCGIRVETQSKLTFGKTVTDLYSDAKHNSKNGIAILGVDREAFVQKVKEYLGRYKA